MDKFPITIDGYNKLIEELKNLKTNERPAISRAISEARELGDLSENAEYHAARERQSWIEGVIGKLESIVSGAEIIDVSKLSGDTIKFGATVKLLDEDNDEENTYKIVGEYEADISKNLISIVSPLARSLIGKIKGDVIEVVTPKAVKVYEILDIEYI